MKPLFLPKETKTAEASFYCAYAEVDHTYDRFHYHKEYELLYHIHNRGTRFIGDSIRRFSDGDLVLVGPNIPHCWHSDDIFYNNPDVCARLINIHFEPDFAGPGFFEMPEMKAAKDLLERARHGIQIYGESAKTLAPEIIGMAEKRGFERVLSLFWVLSKMAEAKEFNLLASSGFCNSFYKNENEQKITDIYNLMMSNYHRDLSLEEVADFANMNPSSFCRFFKNVTNKTFSNVFNEIRIGIACKKLINTESSVSEVGYDCGYHSISYFNRLFMKIKRMTPLEYRSKYKMKQDV